MTPVSTNVYSLALPGSGALLLHASTTPGPKESGLVNISLIEEKCENAASVEASSPQDARGTRKYDLIHETPHGLLLLAGEAQEIRFAVVPEDPARAPRHFNLQVAFAETAGAPDTVVSLDVNPPESCAVSAAPVLGEDPFTLIDMSSCSGRAIRRRTSSPKIATSWTVTSGSGSGDDRRGGYSTRSVALRRPWLRYAGSAGWWLAHFARIDACDSAARRPPTAWHSLR